VELASLYTTTTDPSENQDDTRPTGDAEPNWRRALLACRDSSARKWGVRWLERAGFEVRLTQDGAEAIELLRHETPAVALIDTALRDGNGGRLFTSFRELAADREIPSLTLCYSDKDVNAALEQGIGDVVKKPFNWQLITRRAEQLVRMAQTLRELDRTRSMLSDAQRFVEDAQETIQRSTSIDRLTGLPNRAMFEKILEGALATSPGGVAALLIDLDRFKVINSSLGRHVGDEILAQAAERLGATLRGPGLLGRSAPGPTTSSLARLSGDVFALTLSGIENVEQAAAAARTLTDALSGAFHAGDEEIFLSASVGVALFPKDGEDAESLLQHAELALCEAKRKGGGLVCPYDDSLNRMTERTMALTRSLRGALERDEFRLHYQPLVDATSKRVLGAEALLRWNSPELGSVSPAEFIPLAEESGLMVTIGTWVLLTACHQLRDWIEAGLPPIRMAVNLSLCQLVRSQICNVVRSALQETGIDPNLLELELSERGVLRSDPDILDQLRELKAMGVRLSVDDFGTGNSAIAYLRRFPLDCLKIDRSYVDGLEGSDNDAAITSATIAMAHQLKLGVVAEGVENEQQLQFLRDRDCDEFQGFLFSPAIPAEEFQRLLAEGPADE